MKKYFRTSSKIFELSFMLIISKIKRIISGISGGYISTESAIFPSKSSTTERCSPQPGQSMPKNCLNGQGRSVILFFCKGSK